MVMYASELGHGEEVAKDIYRELNKKYPLVSLHTCN